MATISEKLELLGLHKNEITVYLALWELGQSRAAIIIEHTKLHRNLVYTSLDNLVRKKLVAKMEKGKVAVFEANDPGVIKDNLTEKMETADSAINELRSLMTDKPRDIRIYEGTDGVVAVREKVARSIKPGESYYVMGASYSNTNDKLENYFPKLNREIQKKGGDIKVLVAGEEDPKIITNRGLTWEKNARYLPFYARSPMWMTMFRDVLNISIVGNSPITFSIRSAEAAEGFKKYFEYFWNQKVRVESGLPAVKAAIYSMLDELRPGEEYFVLGAAVGQGRASDVSPMYDEFHAARIAKGVVVNMLANSDNYTEIVERNHTHGDPRDRVSRIKKFISAPPTPMQVNIYRDQCFFILYGDTPAVIFFDQPEIAQVFKNYFNYFWHQESYILKGSAAVKDMWLESLRYRELKFIGARGYFPDRYPDQFQEIIEKAKKVRGLKWKNITDIGSKNHIHNNLPWIEVKYSLNVIKNPNVVWLYGDKVAVVNWTEDEPVVFVSENKALVQSYNDYFEELWNKK